MVKAGLYLSEGIRPKVNIIAQRIQIRILRCHNQPSDDGHHLYVCMYVCAFVCVCSNLLNFLLRCSTRPYETQTHS